MKTYVQWINYLQQVLIFVKIQWAQLLGDKVKRVFPFCMTGKSMPTYCIHSYLRLAENALSRMYIFFNRFEHMKILLSSFFETQFFLEFLKTFLHLIQVYIFKKNKYIIIINYRVTIIYFCLLQERTFLNDFFLKTQVGVTSSY